MCIDVLQQWHVHGIWLHGMAYHWEELSFGGGHRPPARQILHREEDHERSSNHLHRKQQSPR
jgi:hypothetical protein